MSSILTQSNSFDGNTTSLKSPTNLTTMVTTEQFSTNHTLSTSYRNDSCDPDCYFLVKTNDPEENWISKLLYSLLLILLLITISIAVIFRRFQQSRNQQKTGKEYVQNEKNYALPFEEVLVIPDAPQPIELSQITPTTTN